LRRCTCRDDPKGFAFYLDVNDKEEAKPSVHPEDRVSRFILAARVDDLQEGIEERFHGFFETERRAGGC
jgi:hypothetical protein